MDFGSIMELATGGAGLVPIAVSGLIGLLVSIFNLLLLWKVIAIAQGGVSIVTRILSIIVPFYLPMKTTKSIECSTIPWMIGIVLTLLGTIMIVLYSLGFLPSILITIAGALFGVGVFLLVLLNIKLYIDIMYIAEVSTWYIALFFFFSPIVIILLYFSINPEK